MENEVTDLTFTTDLPETEEELEGGSLIPESWYDVVVDSVKGYTTGKTDDIGNQIINVSFKLKVNGGEYDGETIFDTFPLPHPGQKPKSLERFLLMLKRIGVITATDFKARSFKGDVKDAEGTEATVLVIHDTYKGRTKAKPPYDGYHERGWRPDGEAPAGGGIDVSGI